MLQAYVAAGLGFTLLPDLALPTLRPDLVVRPTNPEAPKRRVWAATRPRARARAATEAMVEILREVGQRFADQSAAGRGRLSGRTLYAQPASTPDASTTRVCQLGSSGLL